MSFADTVAPFLNRIMTALPSVLFGLVILLVGYLVARLASSLIERVVRLGTLDDRLARLLDLDPAAGPRAIQTTTARIVFWLVMVLALIGFFNQVGLTLVADPLRAMMETVTAAGPSLLEAGVILAVAWILAAFLRMVVTRLATWLDLDRRLGRFVSGERAPAAELPRTLGTLTFYLVLLTALPPFLGALGQSAIVDPLVGMFRVVLTYLPNVVAAALVVGIGWVVARILREVVRNLLAAAGLDRTLERFTRPAVGALPLSGVVGSIVYFVVWVPFIVAGLDALKIEAVSTPAIRALSAILIWVPKGLGALVIVALAWVVSRFLGNLVAQLARGVGLDGLPARLGLTAGEPQVGGRTLSEAAGVATTAIVLLFALIEAFEVMALAELAGFGRQLIAFVVNVVIAGVIVGIGLWVGGFVQDLLQGALQRAGARRPQLIAVSARYAVAVFALAMALQQIGFGEGIVVTAFALLFGAVCLALALAFGLGAREAAARAVERVLEEQQGGRGGVR